MQVAGGFGQFLRAVVGAKELRQHCGIARSECLYVEVGVFTDMEAILGGYQSTAVAGDRAAVEVRPDFAQVLTAVVEPERLGTPLVEARGAIRQRRRQWSTASFPPADTELPVATELGGWPTGQEVVQSTARRVPRQAEHDFGLEAFLAGVSGARALDRELRLATGEEVGVGQR